MTDIKERIAVWGTSLAVLDRAGKCAAAIRPGDSLSEWAIFLRAVIELARETGGEAAAVEDERPVLGEWTRDAAGAWNRYRPPWNQASAHGGVDGVNRWRVLDLDGSAIGKGTAPTLEAAKDAADRCARSAYRLAGDGDAPAPSAPESAAPDPRDEALAEINDWLSGYENPVTGMGAGLHAEKWPSLSPSARRQLRELINPALAAIDAETKEK